MGGRWNNNYIKQGAVITVSLCIVVLFAQLLGRIGVIFNMLRAVFSALGPVIVGCIIAFLINPIMIFFKDVTAKLLEKYIIKNNQDKVRKVSNILSVVISVLLFIAFIVALLWILIPELADSIEKLYYEFPGYINNVQDWAERTLRKNPEFEEQFSNYISNLQAVVMDFLNSKVMPNMDIIIARISSGLIGGVRFVFNFLIGIIVAVYILIGKDELGAQGKKIIYGLFSKKTGNKVLDSIEYINSVFSGFINGTIIDSILVGAVCAVFCNAVNMPYATLISVVVGVTNVIPFFGPFIGAIPSALLILVEDPMMCLVFVIFILIWQQIDGNIIVPIILGDSTGLSGLWVLVAILVGGDLFGFMGMLLGVPVFACIYTFITILLRNRLKSKGMSNKTEQFLNLRRYDEITGEPVYGEKPKRMSLKKRKKYMKKIHGQHFNPANLHIGKVKREKVEDAENVEKPENIGDKDNKDSESEEKIKKED